MSETMSDGAQEAPEPKLPPNAVPTAVTEKTLQPDQSMIGLVRDMLGELREERAARRLEHDQITKERQSSLRWRRIFQVLLFGMPVILAVLYYLVYLNVAGTHWGPWREVVGIVRIEGAIMPGKQAGADKVNAVLEEAFANAHVKAVVLSIDSPGGAPSEAERIYRTIDNLKKKYPKPVVAVIDNLGASAAYLIAIHADRIVAGRYSLVGSIGAIMETWQLDRALAKIDVSQRVYASGKLKSFLNPFTAPTPDADAKAKQVVTQVAGTFLAEVKAARGEALKRNVDYATGEVWVGDEAKLIGLVDSIGTIDEVVETSWGLKTYKFGPTESGLGLLTKSMSGALENIVERLVVRGAGQLQ
jgi:protease IV